MDTKPSAQSERTDTQPGIAAATATSEFSRQEQDTVQPLKPFLQKAPNDPRFSRLGGNRTLLWLGGIILLAALVIGAVLLFRPAADQEVEVPYRKLFFPHKQDRDWYLLLSGEQSLSDRILHAFIEPEDQVLPTPAHALQVVKQDEADILSPLILQAIDSEEKNFADDMAYLNWLLTQDQPQTFRRAWQALKDAYPQYLGEAAEDSAWPHRLQALRLLLLARQHREDPDWDREIMAQAAWLKSVCADDFPAESRDDFQEMLHPMAYLAEKDDRPSHYELSVVYLDDLDLWVWQSLACLDEDFKPIYQRALRRVQGGRLESGFYAYAWDTQEHSYIPSASATFRTQTDASLRQMISLYEVGEGNPEDPLLFNQLIQRDQGLYTYYHLASLAPMSEQRSLTGILLLKQLALLSGQDLSLDFSNHYLADFLHTGKPQSADDFLKREADQEVYYFTDNVQNLLLLAWQNSTKSEGIGSD